MQATITHIQRMSLHDGAGIRTTVFFKGCNLRCAWCHNPETFSTATELEWVKNRCLHCGECIRSCPAGALSIAGDNIVRDNNRCNLCRDAACHVSTCTTVCFSDAHQIIGKPATMNDLCQQIEEDRNIFEQTGGGVTLSGGEPMLQFPFVKELAKTLSQRGYNLVLQTNLSMKWNLYREILPFINHFMCDLKHLDGEAHQRWTGQSNCLILENILKLDRSGASYRLRTPVVPSVNDSEDDLVAMSAFAKTLKNITSYELLPFHPLAAYKYEQLGLKYAFANVKPIQTESFAGLKRKFEFKNR
jgi:pyruvate formate lyase activating enzyme